MIFLRPTEGAKKVMKKWIEELREQPWSKQTKSNDQPAFNWALNKTAGQVCKLKGALLPDFWFVYYFEPLLLTANLIESS